MLFISNNPLLESLANGMFAEVKCIISTFDFQIGKEGAHLFPFSFFLLDGLWAFALSWKNHLESIGGSYVWRMTAL